MKLSAHAVSSSELADPAVLKPESFPDVFEQMHKHANIPSVRHSGASEQDQAGAVG